MDWLDLILPSPSSSGSGGGGNVLHELPVMNCLPMDTDHIVGGGGECRLGVNSLLNAGVTSISCDDFGAGHNNNSLMSSTSSSSTHNPVLAMSACVSGEAL